MSTAWQPAGDYSDIRYELSPKEIWFLCRQYDARQALDMGLINAVVPLERLEEKTVRAADAQGELQRRRGRPGRIQ